MTKYKVNIHKPGSENTNLLTILATHNGGLFPVGLMDLVSYATTTKAKYPDAMKGFQITVSPEDQNKLLVSEDGGKSFTLSIQECEILELDNEQGGMAD